MCPLAVIATYVKSVLHLWSLRGPKYNNKVKCINLKQIQNAV